MAKPKKENSQSNYTKNQQEFLDQVKEVLGYQPSDNEISVSWTTGGMTGGSCWGSNADQAVAGDPEPEFDELDKLLEHFAPTISFIQYKRLCQELIKTDSKTRSEYYGNYYYEASKTVKLVALADWLNKAGFPCKK